MIKSSLKIITSVFLLLMALVLCSCDKSLGELDTTVTDGLKLTTSYENKEFVADGIGVVEYLDGVDGDTSTFKSAGLSFKLRYYLINTPESTGKIEAWGKAASKFTTGILDSAKEKGGKIVLECDPRSARQDSNNRYLGYVWYQPSKDAEFRLLNLEIVEQAYSKYFTSPSTYSVEFSTAETKAKNSGRRVWGEKDKGYSYSKVASEISLSELILNQDAYLSTNVQITIEVVITRIVGENLYIRDVEPTLDESDNEYYAAMYVFSGYDFKPSTFLSVGDVVKFKCKPGYYNNHIQLSDVNFQLGQYEITGHKEVEPLVITEGTALKETNRNQIVQVTSIIDEVKQSTSSVNNSFTIKCHLNDGTTFNVRVNNNGYAMSNFIEGEMWTFTGGLTTYYDEYEIELGNYKITKDAVFVK